MTVVAVTSIVRSAAADERSSQVYLADLDSGKVLGQIEIPEDPMRRHDPNPRGGFRGTRGIAAGPNRIAIATGTRIYIFNSDWNLKAELTHPWLGGIHDLWGDEDGFWVTSTASDLLARSDWEGRITQHWHWASDPRMGRDLGFRRAPRFDPDIDHRISRPGKDANQAVHLNSVIGTRSGLLLGFGKVRVGRARMIRRARGAVLSVALRTPGAEQAVMRASTRRRIAASNNPVPVPKTGAGRHAIVRLDLDDTGAPGKAQVIATAPTETPNHNLLESNGAIWFNDSDAGMLVGVDPDGGRTIGTVEVPGDPSFCRGLCALSDNLVAVGSQRPAAVYVADIDSREVLSQLKLSDEIRETVYAICPVPQTFL